ncbi:DNA-directed RNA polymerase subunit E'' [archaeon]|nr:DNA-directed RNA polymerase subunit E'' [archaeon]|tara:strand:+ start:510 stop:695 length:186 start_codon:yes stop_codon:yes gene_type:complete
MARKVCKNCKLFVDKDTCPICKGHQFGDSFKGRIFVLKAEKSKIAKQLNMTTDGEYAIKSR